MHLRKWWAFQELQIYKKKKFSAKKKGLFNFSKQFDKYYFYKKILFPYLITQ